MKEYALKGNIDGVQKGTRFVLDDDSRFFYDRGDDLGSPVESSTLQFLFNNRRAAYFEEI